MTDPDGWTADYDALCISVATGCSPQQLLAVLQNEQPQQFESRAAAEDWVQDTDNYDRAWLAIGTHDGAAVAWEDNGWAGADEAKVLALSRTGRFASMFWNVNAVMSFNYAVEGQLRRQFDVSCRTARSG